MRSQSRIRTNSDMGGLQNPFNAVGSYKNIRIVDGNDKNMELQDKSKVSIVENKQENPPLNNDL